MKETQSAKTLEERDRTDVIKASIFSMEKGKEVYEKVRMIRLQDKDYTLLLMADHAPLLGELHGSMHLLLEDEEKHYEKLQGYYSLKRNEFHFLCKTIGKEEL